MIHKNERVYFLSILGYALIQIPEVLMIIYGSIKRRLETTHLLNSNKRVIIEPIINQNENSSRIQGQAERDVFVTSNIRHSITQLRASQNRDTSNEALARALEVIQVELNHIKSECIEKVDNVRAAIVEIERSIGFLSET